MKFQVPLPAKINTPFFLSNCASNFCRETTNENKQVSKRKAWSLELDPTLPSVHGELLEIMLTVPLNVEIWRF